QNGRDALDPSHLDVAGRIARRLGLRLLPQFADEQGDGLERRARGGGHPVARHGDLDPVHRLGEDRDRPFLLAHGTLPRPRLAGPAAAVGTLAPCDPSRSLLPTSTGHARRVRAVTRAVGSTRLSCSAALALPLAV